MTNFGRKILQRYDFFGPKFYKVSQFDSTFSQCVSFGTNIYTTFYISDQYNYKTWDVKTKSSQRCSVLNKKFNTLSDLEWKTYIVSKFWIKSLHCLSLWKGWVILNFESKVYKMSEFVSEYLQRVGFRNKIFKTCPTLDQVAHNVSDLESKT